MGFVSQFQKHPQRKNGILCVLGVFAVNRLLCTGRFGNRREGSTALENPVGLSHSLPSVRGFWKDTLEEKENPTDELVIDNSGFQMELFAPL
jgi:hypothetical protein